MRILQDWQSVSLGDVCEFKYGKSLPEAARAGGDVPVFGSNGEIGRHNEALTLGPTVVIGRKGSFGEVNYSAVPCWPIDTTYYVDETATDVDLRWQTYRLSALGLNRLNRAAAVPGLNREDAYRLTLLLPPLPEQRRIAAILDKADALRAKRRAALMKLDEFAQSIFLDMFGDPATNPKGWPHAMLRDLGRVTTGGTPPTEKDGMFGGSIPFITPGDLESDEPIKRSVTEAGAEEARTVQAGATLVCCIGATIGKIGKATETSAFNQQINAVEWGNSVDPEYGYAVLRFFKPTIIAWGSSTTLPILKKSAFERIEVPVPRLAEQREFAGRIAHVDALQSASRAALGRNDELFATLQSRAPAAGSRGDEPRQLRGPPASVAGREIREAGGVAISRRRRDGRAVTPGCGIADRA